MLESIYKDCTFEVDIVLHGFFQQEGHALVGDFELGLQVTDSFLQAEEVDLFFDIASSHFESGKKEGQSGEQAVLFIED